MTIGQTPPESQAAKVYPVEFAREMKATIEHGQALEKKYPKLSKYMERELDTITSLKLPPDAALARLRVLADHLAKKIAPVAACKAGCSACCHIAVQISGVEAAAIGEAIGQKPATVALRSFQEFASTSTQDVADRWFGVPCSFLVEGKCSIYAHRPLACRLHFNLGATPFFCGTNIRPEYSFVPNYNLNPFWHASAFLLGPPVFGDLREFFGALPR